MSININLTMKNRDKEGHIRHKINILDPIRKYKIEFQSIPLRINLEVPFLTLARERQTQQKIKFHPTPLIKDHVKHLSMVNQKLREKPLK